MHIDGDGKLTQRDFALQLAEYKREVFEAIERNDDTWLRENYPVQITSKWCKEHFALPNVSAMLSRLSVPIYIFQGEDDANVPITEIHHIHDDFHRAGKSNLRIFTFPKHDHDLNYLHYIFEPPPFLPNSLLLMLPIPLGMTARLRHVKNTVQAFR